MNDKEAPKEKEEEVTKRRMPKGMIRGYQGKGE